MNDVMHDLMIRKEKPVVSSLVVADRFEKEHKNVLRDIENLEIDQEFSRLNFEPTSYTDSFNRKQKSYNITQDGFMLLVMGFTGKKAMDTKIKFIKAFNKLAELAFKKTQNAVDGEWKNARIAGKSIRDYQTDIIKSFIAYAIEQGSESAKFYYASITTMEYKALGLLELLENRPEFRRDVLNVIQLGNLWTAEALIARTLQHGMNQKMYYKDIFQLAKQEVTKFAELTGIITIGETPMETLGVKKPPEELE